MRANRFFNRSPWNLIVGLSAPAGVLVVIAAVTSWWVLLLPFLLVAAAFVWRLVVRTYWLVVHGYFAEPIGHALKYEEREGLRLRSFKLDLASTEPGHSELFVPGQEAWERVVPPWAQSRRREISARISEAWNFSDVHFTEEPADA